LPGPACFCLAAILLAAQPALSQPPPFIPPPQQITPAPVNAANPNQRIQIHRPDEPGPNDVIANADSEESEGSIRHLRGHVHLETTDQKLDADEVDYDEETHIAEARGNVLFENYLDGSKLNCDHGTYNVDTGTGVFWDVRGTSVPVIIARPGLLTTTNPFYFEGKWAERTEDRYIIHEGWITDCIVPKPWWRLTATKFDIIPHQRAIAYRAVFHIQNLPLFYFPVYYKSLKRIPRQSGFMTPNIGHSSLYGGMIGLAYYWAISRSYDTFYRIQDFTARGYAHTFDFRGKVKPGTDFTFNLYAVSDRGVNIGNGVIQKQGGVQFTFDGKSDLGDGWDARLHLDYLSSFLFRQSFAQSFQGAIFSESHSVGFIDKHWNDYGLYIVADRDVEFESTIPSDRIIIRKLPEVDFLGHDQQIVGGDLPLWFSFESSAGILDRSQPEYQTGRFVSRLDVYPHLSSAVHLAGWNVTASVGARETEYGSSLQDGLATGGAMLRSAREVRLQILPPSLERIYDSPKWLGGVKFKHVIEPRIEYGFVDGINDFNRIIRFDETDIMSDTNQLTLALANRLYTKDKDGHVTEVLSWDLSQARYFNPTFGGAVVAGQRNVIESSEELDGFAFLDGPRNYSPIISALRFQHVVGVEWRLDYDPLFKRVSNSSINIDYRFLSKYFFSIGQTEVRTDPVVAPSSDQLHGLIGWGNQNRKGWNGATSIYYDYKNHVTVFATVEVTYNTDCCGISVEYRRFNIGTRDDTQYRMAFTVSNIGSFGTLQRQDRIF
jgi:LPS-assembly protein